MLRMNLFNVALPLLASIHVSVDTVHSLSVTESPRAQAARSRLAEAFRSPSKKLTLHPELILPEPSDPTALLLRASEVAKLSRTLRTQAKANAVFVEGTVDALAPMGREQEEARGNFPGPLPIVYSLVDEEGLGDGLEQLRGVDGVEGILVPFFGGRPIESVDGYLEQAANHPTLTDGCGAILEAGLQPIPEIVLAPGARWKDEDVIRLVDAVQDTCGGLDPVAIVVTNGESAEGEGDSGGADGDDDLSVPNFAIPASIAKRLSFVGSVRTSAGGGRMNVATSRLSASKFNGAFLRADCVPGYRLNPDLNVVGGFWSAAIGDLKSLKSKSFSFRSKVKLEKDVPMEWYNYQKDIMDSGALGGPSGGGGDLNPEAGDYKGF